MKFRRVAFIFFLTVLCSVWDVVSATPIVFSGTGSGTNSSPYIITTCTQLAEIELNLSAVYYLGNSINCGAYGNFTPIGQFGNFSGTLDGRGYTISNLTINGGSNSFQGLFSTVSGGTIQNLMIHNESVSAPAIVGGLMARSFGNTTISKVGITSSTLTATSTSANYLGGLVGYWFGAHKTLTITDSYVDATIIGNGYWVGGLIGDIDSAAGMTTTISRSYVAGVVSSTRIVGGFIGNMANASDNTLSVSDSFVVATTTASTTERGGFVGTLANDGYVTFLNSFYDTHGVSSSTLTCAYNNFNFSGCTAVNVDGNDSNHFKNTAVVSPFLSWNFASNWSLASAYPGLFWVPAAFVHPSNNALSVTEGGATTTYSIALEIAPTSTVTIHLTTTSSLSLSTTTLTFLPSNWNVPSTVIVTGFDDHIGVSTHTAYITYGVSSTDANYDNFAVVTTTVTITDNPRPTIFYFNSYQNKYLGSSSTLTGPVFAYVPRLVSSTLYVQYSLDGTTWASTTLSNALDASNGYGSLPTSAGTITNIANPGTIDVYFDWQAGIDVRLMKTPVYLRAIVDDGTQTSTPYENSQYPIVIDTSLTAPGALTVGSLTDSSVMLHFSSSTQEVDFGQYEVYYTTGSATPTTSSTLVNSSTIASLGLENFAGTTSFVLSGLSPRTQYTVSIWAYDAAGHAVSSTPVTFTTADSPVVNSGGVGGFAPISSPPARTNQVSIQPPIQASIFFHLLPNSVSVSTSTHVVVPTSLVSYKRILRLGSVGADVKQLQQFLNSIGFVVAPNGSGSPGKETTYFGVATKKALVKFQEAHAKAILTPYGLTKGTGIFAVASRALVNEMSGGN